MKTIFLFVAHLCGIVLGPNLVQLTIGDIYFFNFLMLHHWYLGLNGDMFWEPSLNRKKHWFKKCNQTNVAKKIPKKTSSKFGPEKKHFTFWQNFVQSKTLLRGPLVAWFSKNQRTGFDQCWLVIDFFSISGRLVISKFLILVFKQGINLIF